MSKELFVYEWALDPDKDTTNIRIYGISPGSDGINRNICLRVENFKPYAYIQLPDKSDDTARAVIDHLQCIESPPVQVEVLKKHHLYNFENKKNKKNKKNKMAPFMFAAFKSKKHIQDMVFHLKHGINILGETMKLKVHETSASPILQMVSLRDIPTSGWINFSRHCPEPVPEDEKMTVCDEEYVIKWKNLDRSARVDQVVPKCMAFDMEVNSDFMNQMPSDRPGDCIFQISCVITEKGRPRRKILLSLKAKDMELAESELLAGVEVRVFDDEKDLLADFMNLIAVEKPNALTGFNIFGFDIEYTMKRAVRFFLVDDFKLIGFNKHIPARIEEVKWSSSAYKNQVFKFINWEGILLLDLLPIIRRDYKLDTYTLKNVATTFLNNNTKDPVTYKDIFIAYRTREKMDMVGKYCVQDSDLCIELMNHLHTWVALSEMAKVCNVSMFTLYTQGQQIKMYSQVYKHCLKENIVVDNDGYEARSNERYRGAHVIEPDPGFYERVVPVDFSSLYPSLIIAYNICPSTITDETTPDDQCNIFAWEDHVGCEHDPKEIKIKALSDKIDDIGKELSALRTKRDEIKASTVPKRTTVKDAKAKIQLKIDEKVALQKPYREKRQELKKTTLADREDEDGNKISGVVCAKRYYRFLKPEVKKGVIPTIIQSLLDSRKRVKGLMKKCEDNLQKVVYDKEQLAYKVSANSMYGAMGVKRGYLPFMPGAMCVTFAGRTALEKTAELIQSKFQGTLVYGDTDEHWTRR
jgi:DNA polymerase elongation subunit (family B)